MWTSLHDRLGSLPGPLRIALTFVAFLFVLNLFSGFDDIWFHWPAAPILFVTSYYLLTRRRRDPK